jgi:hypothetical protein
LGLLSDKVFGAFAGGLKVSLGRGVMDEKTKEAWIKHERILQRKLDIALEALKKIENKAGKTTMFPHVISYDIDIIVREARKKMEGVK